MGCTVGKKLDTPDTPFWNSPYFAKTVSSNWHPDSGRKNFYPRVKNTPCLEKGDLQNQLSNSGIIEALVGNKRDPAPTHFHTKAKFKLGTIARRNEASPVCSTWENEDVRATFEDLLCKEGLRYTSESQIA